MSYLKTKTRPVKYDKTSVEFRKEYERLSKKSKGEYESLGKNDKTELLHREGLPVHKPDPKRKDITQESIYSKLNSDQKSCLQVQKDNLGYDIKASKKVRNPQSPGKSRTEKRVKKVEDLKTKPRLHEQGVASIRPDNPDLKVVMQGKKIEKKSENQGDTQAEEDKVACILVY